MATIEPLRIESIAQSRRAPPLLPSLIGLGIFEAVSDYLYRRHQHLNYELLIPVAGRYRCRLNGEPLVLRRSEVLLVKPGDWHEDQLDAGVRYWAIQFSLTALGLAPGANCFRPGLPAQSQICAPVATSLQSLLGRLREEHERTDLIAMLVQDALLGEIIGLITRTFDPRVLAPQLLEAAEAQSFPVRLERWCFSRLQEPCRVAEMAAAFSLSTTAFTRRCRALLGRPPAKVFADLRLARAHALLLGSGMSVSEIADYLGYRNPFHFSRAFRRRYGVPPSRAARGAT
jgi:AraC-like DNA-binding protein